MIPETGVLVVSLKYADKRLLTDTGLFAKISDYKIVNDNYIILITLMIFIAEILGRVGEERFTTIIDWVTCIYCLCSVDAC